MCVCVCVCVYRLPDGLAGKESTCNAGDTGITGSVLGSGRSPRVGRGNPLQSSCLESPMDLGAWLATVHRVAKNQTQLSNYANTRVCLYTRIHTHTHTHTHTSSKNCLFNFQVCRLDLKNNCFYSVL